MPEQGHTRSKSTRHRSYLRAAAKLAWPRFWARQFDNAICWWIAVGVATLLGAAPPLRGRTLLIVIVVGPMLVGALHLIYEMLMLTMFGTTVGKSVFGLHMVTRDRKRAEFARIFRRSVDVWLRGSCAYVLFPLASFFAWKKSRDELRLKGRTYWDKHSETRITGAAVPMWHLSAGAALAIAGFGMVLLWQTTGDGNPAAPARADGTARNVGASTTRPPSPAPVAPAANTSASPVAVNTLQLLPLQRAPSPSVVAPAAPNATTSANPNSPEVGTIENGKAVFPTAGKSFAIRVLSERPGVNQPKEMVQWAERTYPYFVVDAPGRKALIEWLIAGTRNGVPQGEVIALGIDTIVSGRENGRGNCWPVKLAPDRIPAGVPSQPEIRGYGIRCEH